MRSLAQVVQPPLRRVGGLAILAFADGEPGVKFQTTVVGNHQGPGDPDGVGAFLLVIGRDTYTTYNLPASGTLTIGRGESNAVRVDDPLASRAHARLHVRVDGGTACTSRTSAASTGRASRTRRSRAARRCP